MKGEVEYHWSDFEWEELRKELENDPSISYHLNPSTSSSSSSPSPEEEASLESKAWKTFHIRHSSGTFFKERRYLLKEFSELVSCDEHSKVLEVGCGNGSTALPILRGNENIIVYACDCSPEALERAKETIYSTNGVSAEHRFHPFYCDFTVTGFPKWLVCDSCHESSSQNYRKCHLGVGDSNVADLSDLSPSKKMNHCIGGIDFVTLIFTLSAVPFNRMPIAVKECFSVLKPGGLFLFRDYGLYDMTMLRFEPDQRVGFREYMRSDGTRSYFFSLETVRELFVGAGFSELELEYCCVKSLNRRNGKHMRRVWVHGKFQKPLCGEQSC